MIFLVGFGFGQDDYVLPSSTTEYFSNAFRSFNWTSFLPFDYVGIAALQIKIYEGNGTLFVGLGDIQANFSVNVSGVSTIVSSFQILRLHPTWSQIFCTIPYSRIDKFGVLKRLLMPMYLKYSLTLPSCTL
jgi:hypothetical protein